MLELGTNVQGWTEPLYFAACLLASGIWIAVGIYKLFHYRIMVETIRRHHIPLPVLGYWCSVIAEFAGALLVITQWSVTGGALIWLIFLLVATPIYHGKIWTDGGINYPQFVHIFKNVSIAGGLLALIALDVAHTPAARQFAASTVAATTK